MEFVYPCPYCCIATQVFCCFVWCVCVCSLSVSLSLCLSLCLCLHVLVHPGMCTCVCVWGGILFHFYSCLLWGGEIVYAYMCSCTYGAHPAGNVLS